MKAVFLAGTVAGALVVCGCSGLNPDQDRANTIAKVQAECAKLGKVAVIDDVHQDPDGSGGYYTVVKSHCIPAGTAPNSGGTQKS